MNADRISLNRNKHGVQPSDFLIVFGGKIDKYKKQVLMLMDLGYAAEGSGPLPNHGSRKPLDETVTFL